VIQSLVRIVFILADNHISDGLLMVPRNGLGDSPDLGCNQHSELQSHRIIGYFHFSVLYCQLHLWCHKLRILVNGYLVDWGIVLFLFLFSLLLFFLWSHTPSPNNIIITEVSLYPTFTMNFYNKNQLQFLINSILGRRLSFTFY
jgi:hypothetical protein